jgi:hypothetical protein
MVDDEHAGYAALRSSKTGVRDSLGSTIVPPPPSDSASDRSSYDDEDEDLSALDGDSTVTATMDEDPDAAFEEDERGPLADFDDDELRRILARADLDAEDDGHARDDSVQDDSFEEDHEDFENAEEDDDDVNAPMSTSAALAALKSTRPRTARAAGTTNDAQSAKPARAAATNKSAKIVGPNLAAKAWFADLATLRNRQRLVEHRELAPALDKLEPELEALTRRDAEATQRERVELGGDLNRRLKRVRDAVTELGRHVVNIRGGDEYVRELGRLMDGAEKDIVALKEAQRSAFDALQKEEKELSRYVDDFAQRLDDPSVWGADASRALITGMDHRTAKAQRKIYGTKRPVSAGTVLRGAAKDEPWTVEKTPARRGSGYGSGTNPDDTGLSPAGSNKPRPASARDPVSPWARGAATTSARRTPGRGGLNDDENAEKTPPPKAVAEYEKYAADYGPTGGWADVDHARWRRCLARTNMNYGNAVVLAAEELAPFGIERAEVVRHARWDAEREELFNRRKAAVAKWRAEQREAERDKRDALNDEMRTKEITARREREERFNARRLEEKARLAEWKEKKRMEEEAGAARRRAEERAAVAARAEAARIKRKEREEREARNAARAQARWEAAEAARAAAEAAAEALIPKAVDVTAAEARAERERLAQRAMETAKKRRDAATAKDKELLERKERQKAAGEKLAARRRLAEGRSEEVTADPDRITRSTASTAMRVASDRPDRGLFDARPAVQYVQHRATPSWTAGHIR